MSFHRLSLFLNVSSSIIGGVYYPNVVVVSSMIHFFSSFVSLSYLSKYIMVLVIIVISDSDFLVLVADF